MSRLGQEWELLRRESHLLGQQVTHLWRSSRAADARTDRRLSPTPWPPTRGRFGLGVTPARLAVATAFAAGLASGTAWLVGAPFAATAIAAALGGALPALVRLLVRRVRVRVRLRAG